MACHGSNHAALEFFGLQWMTRNDWRGCLQFEGFPLFTAPSVAEMREGNHLISSTFLPRKPTCAQRRLALCFDQTYLQACSQLCTTSKGHVLLGGPHRCANFDLPDESQKVLKDRAGHVIPQKVDKDRTKATDIESVVLWDPTRCKSGIFEIGAFPVTAQADRHGFFEARASAPSKQRGQWEVLHRIGGVLEAADSVRFILADKHGSHNWLASWLLGRTIDLPQELMDLVPFFKTLRFEDLPECRFVVKYRIALQGSSPVHFVPGPAHAQKNWTEQLRSSLSTPTFGLLWSDWSGALELGLYPVAFQGTDTMSDRQSGLWFLGITCMHDYACVWFSHRRSFSNGLLWSILFS